MRAAFVGLECGSQLTQLVASAQVHVVGRLRSLCIWWPAPSAGLYSWRLPTFVLMFSMWPAPIADRHWGCHSPLLLPLWLQPEQLLCCAYSDCCCYLVTRLFLTLLQMHGLQPTRLFCSWDFPGKNTGVGCHFILQGIFPIQGLNPHLLHWQTDSLPLGHQGSLLGSPPPQKIWDNLSLSIPAKSLMPGHITYS